MKIQQKIIVISRAAYTRKNTCKSRERHNLKRARNRSEFRTHVCMFRGEESISRSLARKDLCYIWQGIWLLLFQFTLCTLRSASLAIILLDARTRTCTFFQIKLRAHGCGAM